MQTMQLIRALHTVDQFPQTENLIRALLAALGEKPDREGLRGTRNESRGVSPS